VTIDTAEAVAAPARLALAGIRCTAFADVTILTVSAEASEADILHAFAALVDRPRQTKLLWDLRARKLSPGSLESLRAQAQRLVDSAATSRARGRSAVVVATEEDGHVVRLLKEHVEVAGYGLELAVFREDREALDWLFGRARVR
jgi:hypothetical protein